MLESLSLPYTLTPRSVPVLLRRAQRDDLDALMALLSDDPVSASRGDVASDDDRSAYLSALELIVADPGNELLLVVDQEGHAVATMQLTRIPGMARRGSTRLLVEAVRVRSGLRSSGIGTAMMRWILDVAAPGLDAKLVQLTSDAQRTDAHRFYERLGFVGSHVGYKYRIG